MPDSEKRPVTIVVRSKRYGNISAVVFEQEKKSDGKRFMSAVLQKSVYNQESKTYDNRNKLSVFIREIDDAISALNDIRSNPDVQVAIKG